MSMATHSAPVSEHTPLAVPSTAARRRVSPFLYVTGAVGFVIAALARAARSNSEAAMLRRLRNRPSLLDGGPSPECAPFVGAERFGA